jgi:hypothetical protein
MQILQVDLKKKRQIRQFLDLPFMIYRQTPQWVPPLEMDARQMLDPTHHLSNTGGFLHSFDDTNIHHDQKINNRNYNTQIMKDSFYLFEC